MTGLVGLAWKVKIGLCRVGKQEERMVGRKEVLGLTVLPGRMEEAWVQAGSCAGRRLVDTS